MSEAALSAALRAACVAHANVDHMLKDIHYLADIYLQIPDIVKVVEAAYGDKCPRLTLGVVYTVGRGAYYPKDLKNFIHTLEEMLIEVQVPWRVRFVRSMNLEGCEGDLVSSEVNYRVGTHLTYFGLAGVGLASLAKGPLVFLRA